jgi:AcrR family transcriptional regulator
MANISKKQKEINRRKILELAADYIAEHGFKSMTMKRLAKLAGIGDATIYKYFPTKEDLLIDYYEYMASISVDEVREIPEIKEYTLHESLLVLMDTYLKELDTNKEFVSISLKLIFKSPSFLFRDVDPVKKHFKPLLREMLENAVKNGEIPEPPSYDIVSNIICEAYFGIVLYWLKDDSEDSSHTTQLSDILLALVADILKAGVLNKGMELFSFFLKAHFYGAIEKSGGAIEKLSEVVKALRRQNDR